MQLPKNTLLQGGKYRIEKVLGQGGFGITYLATQELLDRKVCIKEFFFKDSCSRNAGGEVTLGTIGNKDLVDRFLNKFIKEARTLSQLDHPNIIRILDIFKENGTAYYVMDYIEGSSLEDIVNSRGALSESEAITYIKQVANALEYIHQRSINHLDVKPANIMVRRSDNKAILIDFGVSKQYDSQGEQTSTTPVGISYGYAPIEQYRPGGVITFSPQADIYALGATLYKLVTGNIPPQAIEIFNEGSLRLPQSLSSNISNAIQNAMELKKSDRPTSVEEFLSTLNVSNTNQKAFSFTASKSIVSESMVQTSSITNSCKERFVKIVVDALGVEPKDVIEKASIRNDLGADSLDAMDIIIRVEGEFGILINEDDEFDEFDDITVGDAISFLEKAMLKKDNCPLSIKEFLNNINAFKTNQKESSKSLVNETTKFIKPTKPKNEINNVKEQTKFINEDIQVYATEKKRIESDSELLQRADNIKKEFVKKTNVWMFIWLAISFASLLLGFMFVSDGPFGENKTMLRLLIGFSSFSTIVGGIYMIFGTRHYIKKKSIEWKEQHPDDPVCKYIKTDSFWNIEYN